MQEVVEEVAGDLLPHRICEYVFKVVSKFSEFFRDCRVIGSPEQEERLVLCLATQAAVQASFSLLGITPVNRL